MDPGIKKTILIILLFPFVCFGGCVASWNIHAMPRRAYERLLSGEKGAKIKSLALTNDRKRILLDDQEVMEYLTEAFRSSRSSGQFFASVNDHARETGDGVLYDAELQFWSGTAKCSIYFPKTGGTMSVSEPMDPWYINDPLMEYIITLPEPIPEPLAKLLPQQ